MAKALSISAAWDETKARFAADGGLLMTVALALIALPSAIAEFVFPNSGLLTEATLTELIVMLVVALIVMVGQLALIRLVVGPSTSVGEAIAHGARRAPAYIGAALILLVLLFLIAMPFSAVLLAMGVSVNPSASAGSGGATLVMLLFLAIVLYLSTRLLPMSAVASIAEDQGPISIIRRAWMLTSGHFFRLIGFLLLFLVGALVAIFASSLLTGAVVKAIFGATEPFSVAALIMALVISLVTAAVTAVFIVMVARIYAQLAGREASVSVPSSGT